MANSSNEGRDRQGALSLVFVASLVILWLLFLFFQRGHTWDESEHAHVSWLISQGKKPLDDFFQHHQPLLWSLLALYYRVGFHGAGVLIWGRILVMLSGLTSLIALFALGRRTTPSPRILQSLGVIVFMGLTFLIRELFVIRPETIAAACFFVALALWDTTVSAAGIFLAGILAGAAVYASPRFALLGLFFFLIGSNSVRRWLLLCTGGIVFVASYTLGSGFGPGKVIFNLRFSSYLQSVGEQEHGIAAAVWIIWLILTTLLLTGLMLLLKKEDRRRGAALLLYTVMIFIACHRSAGLFRYSQAYAAWVIAVAIVAAWMGGRIEWRPQMSFATAPVVAALLVFPPFTSIRPRRPPMDFLTTVRAHNEIAALIPAGQTVLVFTRDSPITAYDSSYYGIPLGDGQDRLCRTIRDFHSNVKLPDCDFLKTLENAKPYLTEASISQATRGAEAGQAKDIIKEDYRRVILDNHSTDIGMELVQRTSVSAKARP